MILAVEVVEESFDWFPYFFVIFILIILFFSVFSQFLVNIKELKSKMTKETSLDDHNPLNDYRTKSVFDNKTLSDKEIKIIDDKIDKEEIIDYIFTMFNMVAAAYSNKNIKSVKPLFEQELFEDLARKQNRLYQLNKIRVLKNIKLDKGEIVSITRLDKEEKIKISLTVLITDYEISEMSKSEIIDENLHRSFEVFEVDVIRYKDKKAINCKNCGAPLTNKGSNTCSYCGSEKEEESLKCTIENIKLHRKEQN